MSPLTWLDAWLDNMMANVPELAVCYHKQGVVQGYELLKTEDLFLLKGMGADGTISFHPQVVHANAAAVLQFLQENCTSEPGAYWVSGSCRCLAFEDSVTKFSSSIDSPLSGGEKVESYGIRPGESVAQGVHEGPQKRPGLFPHFEAEEKECRRQNPSLKQHLRSRPDAICLCNNLVRASTSPRFQGFL